MRYRYSKANIMRMLATLRVLGVKEPTYPEYVPTESGTLKMNYTPYSKLGPEDKKRYWHAFQWDVDMARIRPSLGDE